MSRRASEKAKETARMGAREQVMDYYLAHTNGKPPLIQCEEKKGYNQMVIWWLEPPLKDAKNYLVVEGEQGGLWFVRIEEDTSA